MGPGRLFAAMDSRAGKGADGMCVDRAGNVYCAGPKHIWIWSPSGELLEKTENPERPINCTLGDSDLRSLYITGFGGLYRIRMNAYGVASNPPFEAGLVQGTDKRPTTELPPSAALHLNIVYIPMEIENCVATYSVRQRPAGTFPLLSSSTG